MTPVCLPDTPMDLSTKTRRKLRLEEFLRQNLDQAPAGRVIQWTDRVQGVFRILWTHQSSGAFTQQDAALFRYWALARGKPPNLSSVELKQSLRMALNKSPSVQRLPTSHDEYRYFRFTEWGSRKGSTRSSQESSSSDESKRKMTPPSLYPPPLLPLDPIAARSPRGQVPDILTTTSASWPGDHSVKMEALDYQSYANDTPSKDQPRDIETQTDYTMYSGSMYFKPKTEPMMEYQVHPAGLYSESKTIKTGPQAEYQLHSSSLYSESKPMQLEMPLEYPTFSQPTCCDPKPDPHSTHQQHSFSPYCTERLASKESASHTIKHTEDNLASSYAVKEEEARKKWLTEHTRNSILATQLMSHSQKPYYHQNEAYSSAYPTGDIFQSPRYGGPRYGSPSYPSPSYEGTLSFCSEGGLSQYDTDSLRVNSAYSSFNHAPLYPVPTFSKQYA